MADFTPSNNHEGWRGSNHDVDQDTAEVQRLRRESGQAKENEGVAQNEADNSAEVQAGRAGPSRTDRAA